MKIKAYAKVNLSLDVTGKRSDGYHTLCSVFQSVSLCDIVEVISAEKITITCSNEQLNGENNLCYMAAVEFFQTTEISGGADIFIQKYIPLAGGLGGGSADAGAVLWGLNEFFGKPLSLEQLLKIATGLGADVPFCMLGGTKLCEGIGEIMTDLPKLPHCHIVIAKKGQKSSTGDMYRALDNGANIRKSDIEGIINGLENCNLAEIFKGAYNCFEAVYDSAALEEVRKIAEKQNALYCGLSGAGPSVISVFENQKFALLTYNALKELGFEVYLTEPTEKGLEIIE